MDRELFDRIWRSMRPCISIPPVSIQKRPQVLQGQNILEERIKQVGSGTTILAFRYKDGILMAADRKRTRGSLISSQDVRKIRIVDQITGFLGAGTVSDINYLLTELCLQNQHYLERFGYPLTLEGKVRFTANLAREWYMATGMWGLNFHAIIAGRNTEGDFHIYEIGSDGYWDEGVFKYAGSGEDGPLHVLHEKRDKIREAKLTLAGAVELGARAIYRSGEIDVFSSDVRVVYPKFATITSEGLSFVDDKLIAKICERVILREGNKNGR